ncbi:hypothetical protein D9757_013191 [Collybiopsis confluens]|uniref:Alpha-type protein kinase domain-containing protein n=1 Tax=Collybiopsis confluens TaxID=2823264 RepID=A0A8H5CYH9_9AGAR|nr:hypothetical protein D9757_013191 [Collybiopsis confluens]
MLKTKSTPINIPNNHNALAQKALQRFNLNNAPAKSKMSTSQVQQIITREQGARSSEYSYVIHWVVDFKYKPSKLSVNLGSFATPFKGSIYMEEIKKDLLKQANEKWNHNEVHDFVLISEAEFRFHRNRNPIPGTEHLKLDEFYAKHSEGPMNDLYVNNFPAAIIRPSKTAKERALYLLLTIDYKAYHARLSHISIQSTFKAPENLEQIDLRAYERSRVQFQRIDVELDAQYQIRLRVDSNAELISGRLDDKPFAHGGMKIVYNLQLGPKEFVAKRYYKFANHDENVGTNSIDEFKVSQNYKWLSLDAGRLAQCKVFLKEFYDFCQFNNIERIDCDIVISEHFLLKETEYTPSKASGIKLPADVLGLDEGMTWLIEPKRPSTFLKFTGTMSHTRTHTGGLTSETIHAFAHFVYIFTKQQLVLADLQGTRVSANGKNQLVLFDPMTHTVNGLSGAGDHGREGIHLFEQQHSCGPVCDAMGLSLPSESDEEALQVDHPTRRSRHTSSKVKITKYDPIRDDPTRDVNA